MTLVFDTETTGKADFKQPAGHVSQPHLVQIGAQLFDGEEVFAELNLIVLPVGFTIPQEVSAIHGITNEKAFRCGVPVEVALRAMQELFAQAETHAAFNISFDRLILATAFKRAGMEYPSVTRSGNPTRDFCVMKAMTPVCKLPGPYGLKWPNLREAYAHCFGKGFDGAHNAMADVRATREVLNWLRLQRKETV